MNAADRAINQRRKGAWYLFFALLICAHSLYDAVRTTGWSATKAHVTCPENGHLVYEWTIDGMTYSFTDHYTLAASINIGRDVVCLYDPKMHSDCVLDPTPVWVNIVTLILLLGVAAKAMSDTTRGAYAFYFIFPIMVFWFVAGHLARFFS